MLRALQLVMFADDKIVSKGMVKYASLLPRESVIDVEGKVFVPKDPVQGCSQSEVGTKKLGCYRLDPLQSYAVSACMHHPAFLKFIFQVEEPKFRAAAHLCQLSSHRAM